MRCLQYAITQTLDHAYAHHIQRLMVTGNSPCWPASIRRGRRLYWGVYIDALEWVEITNTRGMSQFADGGIVGQALRFVGQLHAKWGRIARPVLQAPRQNRGRRMPLQQPVLAFPLPKSSSSNATRIGMVYRTWDKMPASQQQALLDRGDAVLANLESL